MTFRVQAVEPFLHQTVHAAGNAGDIAVRDQTAERLAVLQKENTLPGAARRDSCRGSRDTAAADDDVGTEFFHSNCHDDAS